MINPKALLGGAIHGLARHVYLLATSVEYRKLAIYNTFYGGRQRFTKTRIKCCGRQLIVPDIASFLSMYEEIFFNRIYEVEAESPRILDLGANIGLSVLWFKMRYPASEVIAYEADSNIFGYLQANVAGLGGITLYNEAVWDKDTKLPFFAEGADGGRIEGAESANTALVSARNIRAILQENGSFDFIKMDIEGAEVRVLPACRGLLRDTGYVFCEYHSTEGEPQHLDEMLAFLKDEGFYIHLQPVNTSRQPFLRRNINTGFDMQLNIFAWKA